MKHIISNKKVVLFGELMMRLSTKRYERLVQAREFDVSYSGAEANVGANLAAFGIESHVVSSVPDNAIGEACLRYMRQFGLNLDHVRKNGFRLGIYYVETGAAQRPSTFLYNRKGSSITELRPADFDWDEIFFGKHWFHFTGITLALSDSMTGIMREACEAAKKTGVSISCDLNYRKKLWPKEKAREVMASFMKYVDVLFTNEEEAETVFGISAKGSDPNRGVLNEREYEAVAVELNRRFDLKYVSISLRESISATENNWAGVLYDGTAFYRSRKYHIGYVVDRIGGGDAYASGVIYGLLTDQDPQQTIEFAAAASCLKHSVHGDANLVSFDEVLALMNGNGSGRIER